LKVPTSATLGALKAVVPTLLSYTLSFLIIAIMWVNHHHMMHLPSTPMRHPLGEQQPAFWMSLIPFVTAYLGQTHGAPSLWPSTLDLTFCAAGFTLLRYLVTADPHGHASALEQNRRAIRKSLWSCLLYASSVPLALCTSRCRSSFFY